MSVTATINDADVRGCLDRLAQLGQNLSTPMRAVALTLDQLVRNTFRSESDPWGNPWPPHSPVTEANRLRRKQHSVQMLIDSGALYGSIGHESDATSATIFAGTDYAEVHQFGNPSNKAWGRGRAPIPARPFFPLPDLPDAWWEDALAPFDSALGEAIA